MNFSIILASRDRPSLLDSLLQSIVNTTADKNNCEVLAVIDSDDRTTRRYTDKLKTTCPFAKFIVKDRSPNLNDEYLNWAWRTHSTGKNIFIVNDDVVFKTKNWDHHVMADLNNYLSDKPDGIAYGWVEDNLANRACDNMQYCCFPIITRKAAETVGFVMPPQFPGWGADIGVFRIYNAVNRVLRFPRTTVEVDHISYHNGSRGRDHISFEVERRSQGTINPASQFDIGPYVDRIMERIFK